MKARLYIKDRFITSLDELQLLVEEAGDNPSNPVAKQLIASACDGILGEWLRNILNSDERWMTMSIEYFEAMKGDNERWKFIKQTLTGNLDEPKWNWADKIELIKCPDDETWKMLDIWGLLEKGENVSLSFSFHCKEIMDEQLELRMLNQCRTLNMNKSIQNITFNVDGGIFKSAAIELYIQDEAEPIWKKERDNGIYSVNGISFNMVHVDGGTFQMGGTSEQGTDASKHEKPVHSVEVNDFCICDTLVTQRLWIAVMGENPSHFKGDLRPVTNVTYKKCLDFIEKLNNLTGKSFRLPSEEEWEYSAKGGSNNSKFKYSGGDNINDVAWFNANGLHVTHDVATKKPNALGLYDMSGNVWEWCSSDYMEYETKRAKKTESQQKITRGGCTTSTAKGCRTSRRYKCNMNYGSNYLGFRLAI